MAEEENERLRDGQEKMQNAASSSSSSSASTSQRNLQTQRQQNPPVRRLSGPTMSNARRRGSGARSSKRSSPIRSIFNAVVRYLYSDPNFLEALSVDEACQLYALHKQATGIFMTIFNIMPMYTTQDMNVFDSLILIIFALLIAFYSRAE